MTYSTIAASRDRHLQPAREAERHQHGDDARDRGSARRRRPRPGGTSGHPDRSRRSFSTGADLDEAVGAATTLEAMEYNRSWRNLTYSVEHLPEPVIAAISGHCITGGMELALCCDIRIAAVPRRSPIGQGHPLHVRCGTGMPTAKEVVYIATSLPPAALMPPYATSRTDI